MLPELLVKQSEFVLFFPESCQVRADQLEAWHSVSWAARDCT